MLVRGNFSLYFRTTKSFYCNLNLETTVTHFTPFSLHLSHNRVFAINRPQVMAILNVTPDSFFCDSRCDSVSKIEQRVQRIVDEGADMIDIGAYSTHSGAPDVPVQEEIARLRRGMEVVKRLAPHMVVSVDTFRAQVAKCCVEEMGVHIINDVSGGTLDDAMFDTVAQLQVPYILMHMRGTPATMQQLTHYDKPVAQAVIEDLQGKLDNLKAKGAGDVILDPGFGFSKTVEQNFELFRHLDDFHELNLPLLVGISRKTMIYKTFDCTPVESLNGTTVLNTLAMLHGSHIVRVHDVKAAVEARRLIELAEQSM